MRGWLGEHADANEIIDIVNGEFKFPCHLEVRHLMEDDDSDIEFEDACNVAPHCTGALIYMNNSSKSCRDPNLFKLQQIVGKSDQVFHNRQEMVEYHTLSFKNPPKPKKPRKTKWASKTPSVNRRRPKN